MRGKGRIHHKRFLVLCLTFFLTILALTRAQHPFAGAQTGLEITVEPNRAEYYQRDHVGISGNLSYGAEPVSDELVGLQVNDQRGNPIIYRALSTGGTPIVDGAIVVQEITPTDYSTGQPRICFKIGADSFLAFRITIRNDGPPADLRATLTVFDGNMVPMGAVSLRELWPAHEALIWYPTIPLDETSAYIGPAKAIVAVFTDLPSNGGVPTVTESVTSFGIVRGDIFTSSVPQPSLDDPPPLGTFNTTFRFGPQPSPGEYRVYVSAFKSGLTAIDNSTFRVRSSRLDVPSAPLPSFTFSPLRAYSNAPVKFDALASSPENYNDTIAGFEWDWGDGSPKSYLPGPTALHTFVATGTYNVTLRVTDADATWGITTKPVIINPPDPPVANFTWSPIPPVANFTTTFNASTSQPGWDGMEDIPIVSYRWNFSDGNITTVTIPLISHNFPREMTYNVTLTVTDSNGLQDSRTHSIRVQAHMEGDINGDGKVDGKDITIAARAFGSRPGDPRWDARADVNSDGKVDGRDITIIAKNFGKTLGGGGVQSYTDTPDAAFEVATVTTSASPPQALFSFTPAKKYVDASVDFDASASSPENFDDLISGYEWDWGDGSPKSYLTSPSVSHTFAAAGTYNVTLRVTDTDGWCIAIKPITIQPPDLGQMAVTQATSVSQLLPNHGYEAEADTIEPSADFTKTPSFPFVGELVLFDASASYDPDGTIVEYFWDFGDGFNSSVGPITTHAYQAIGTFNVTLTVTDNDGETDQTSQTITTIFGRVIDVFVGEYGTPYPDPYGGQGPNIAADMFEPQKTVSVWARVTYNAYPLQGKLVTFIIISPHNLHDFVMSVITNTTGYAYAEFGIPWPCVDPVNEIFGTWNVTAQTDIQSVVVEDTVAFKVWYLTEITSVVPEATSFIKGDTAGFDIYYRTYRMQPIDGLIWLTVYDNTGVPIGFVCVQLRIGWGNYTLNQFKNHTIHFETKMPRWASMGAGAAYANALHVDLANPYNMGSPMCPEKQAAFNIDVEP